MTEIKRIGVLAHPSRPDTHPVARDIAAMLCARGVDNWVHTFWSEDSVGRDVACADIVMAIGGDGAMLRAGRVCAEHGGVPCFAEYQSDFPVSVGLNRSVTVSRHRDRSSIFASVATRLRLLCRAWKHRCVFMTDQTRREITAVTLRAAIERDGADMTLAEPDAWITLLIRARRAGVDTRRCRQCSRAGGLAAAGTVTVRRSR